MPFRHAKEDPEPTFRIALFDSSYFCVPLEVLYTLLTCRGECDARPTDVP
jgi:hypothetical protein